jgi:hypothetical protein
MNGPTRRNIQMGDRADGWNDQHPDDDPGNAGNAARLKALVQQARVLLAQQREGFVNRHTGTLRKRLLRRDMSGPIAHLSAVGRVAAAEKTDLATTFRFKPSTSTSLAFQTAVDGMITAAQAHRELLVKHGLAVPMLDALVQMREQYDAAVVQCDEGRSAHVAATRSLKKISTEIARTVRVMDGRNRQRFQHDSLVLGAWISASTVLGTPRGTTEESPKGEQGTTPVADDVRPAA